jgi:hypothetical protein
MEAAVILKMMVQALSSADLKPIRKARGLPGKDTDSRQVFAWCGLRQNLPHTHP